MLPIKVKETNSDVEMTDSKSTKVHKVNESQVRTLLNSILRKSM